MWLTLGLALIALNLFAYQTLLVPQTRNYHANWYGAQWISAANQSGASAFYRKTFTLSAPPTGAFLAVQMSQYGVIYANGVQIDSTRDDYVSGATNRAYLYDVTPYLQAGQNTIALCTINADDSAPASRAVLGLVYGGHTVTEPTNASWLATGNAALAGEPCSLPDTRAWSLPGFDDSAWPRAGLLKTPAPADGVMPVRPVTLETPLSTSWLSAGSGNDAFFYRSVRLPNVSDAWLRVASSGDAQVFINGVQALTQPAKVRQDQSNHALPAEVIVTAGVYDVTPYLHAGDNSIGVHVTTIGTDLKTGSPRARPAAMTLDLFAQDGAGRTLHMTGDQSWWASQTASAGWWTGSGVDHWASAIPIDSAMFGPRAAPFLATQKALLAHNVIVSDGATLSVFLATTALFTLACVCGVGLQVAMRRRTRGLAAMIDRVALAFIPMLALVGLLLTLNLEPLMPRPFPYTRAWLGIILAVAALTFIAILASDALRPYEARLVEGAQRVVRRLPWRISTTSLVIGIVGGALVLVGFLMVTYNLPYESYWQDEVTSVYAAKGILATGLPRMISGFIYVKAELYSYMLAVPVGLFGDGPFATRAISIVEYLASLVLTYFIGRYFLGRRAALLALLLLALSPMALRWGREARMYQQAELFLLISVYLFYRAVQPKAPTRYIYLSLLSIVVMYLSHEETFIVLPVFVIYFLVTQRLTWLRNPHWWIAGCPAIAIILLELYLTKATHPPVIGTDHTQQPLIAFSPENVNYYLRLLFASRGLKSGSVDELGLTSTLATLAMAGALFSRDRALRYLSLCLIVPLLMLALVFSLTSDRYIFPLLPIFCFLAAATVVWALDTLRKITLVRLGPVARHVILGSTALLLIAMLVSAQTPSLANFGLASSRTLGISYRHQYPEYQLAGDYIRAHWQKGDILITVSPAIDAAFYAERPSYLLYQSKALYLFEQDGHIVDTPTGSTVLLNGSDLSAVLGQYHRIWLWSSAGYQCCGHTLKFPLAGNFALVYEGDGTLVYLRSA